MLNRILIITIIATCLVSCRETEDRITFTGDVAPIIRKNCTQCHNPQGPGPFTLFKYNDVSKRSRTILKVLNSGYMPPWYADTSYSHFENERYLSREQINKIQKWVDGGKERGSFFDFESIDEYTNFSDLEGIELSPNQKVAVPGDNKEYFVKILVPFENDDRYKIKALNFVPGEKKYVHHANYAIYSLPDTTSIKELSFQTVYADQNDSLLDQYSTHLKKMVFYLGWIPGSGPVKFDEGYGFELPKKGIVMFTLHFAASSIDLFDDSKLELYHDDKPIKKKLSAISLGSGGLGTIKPQLIIEPNSIDTFRLQQRVPQNIRIHYLWPHMHLLGKSFEAFIKTTDNQTVPLIKIPEWDFDWQEGYKLKQPLSVSRGAEINIIGVYDNTTNNVDNPFNPPQRIYSTGYMETRKEMMTLVLLYSGSK